jgi:hypothetical protein
MRGGRNHSIFKISILESEVALFPLTPRAFPIEIHVHPLLVLFRDRLRLGMPLEPREVLHVEPPRLSLQLFGREEPGSDSRLHEISNRVITMG